MTIPKFIGIKAPESISDMIWNECKQLCDNQKLKLTFVGGENKIKMYCTIPRKMIKQMEERGIERPSHIISMEEYEEIVKELSHV